MIRHNYGYYIPFLLIDHSKPYCTASAHGTYLYVTYSMLYRPIYQQTCHVSCSTWGQSPPQCLFRLRTTKQLSSPTQLFHHRPFLLYITSKAVWWGLNENIHKWFKLFWNVSAKPVRQDVGHFVICENPWTSNQSSQHSWTWGYTLSLLIACKITFC